MVRLAALALLAAVSCPPPGLSPGLSAAPSAAPAPARLISVRGPSFVDPEGKPLRLQGIGGVCCTEVPENLAKLKGWPLVTPDSIRELAAAGGNFVAIRLGPFMRASEGPGYSGYAEAPDGRYNLDVFEPAYFSSQL